MVNTHDAAERVLAGVMLKDIMRNWGIQDSPLFSAQYDLTERNEKGFKDFSFENRFFGILPDSYKGRFKDYLWDTLGAAVGEGNAVEFGGEAARLAQGFNDLAKEKTGQEYFFEHFYGVTLSTGQTLSGQPKNHTIVNGDIREPNLTAMGLPDKYRFILCSLMGGDATIPRDPKKVLAILENWYEHLQVGGLMLVDYPSDIFLPGKTPKWVLRQNLINSREGLVDLAIAGNKLRLVKFPNPPEKLFIIQ